MKVRLQVATKKQQQAAVEYGMTWLREQALPRVTRNVCAIILWQLHVDHGWGKKRLLDFLNKTSPMINGMLDYYDFDTNADALWICERKLKTEVGIDLSKIDLPYQAKAVLK